MANPDHLKILEQGVEVWNEWRKKNPNLKPNLSNANLIGRRLSNIDFYDTNLKNAKLVKASLTNADLSWTNLEKANLRNADLRGTNLNWATIFHTNLIEANFSWAELYQTSIDNSNFEKAKFKMAWLCETEFGRYVNFSKADLTEANLSGSFAGSINFSNANLHGSNMKGIEYKKANFTDANLVKAMIDSARLHKAKFVGANFSEASLVAADFTGSNFENAVFTRANLYYTNMQKTNLRGADLFGAILIGTNFEKSRLINCEIYGIAAWGLNLKNAIQENLIITSPGGSVISVDNLEVAQFIYLLINNERIRQIITTITSKVVLILGRFTPEQKVVLDEIRKELHNKGFCPVMFDFEKSVSRDTIETISILAHMAHFVIADLTRAASLRQELGHIVPLLPSVPIQPILKYGSRLWPMYDHIAGFKNVLEIFRYRNLEDLLISLQEKVIIPAEKKVSELRKKTE